MSGVRVAFAAPQFGPQNALFAPDSFVFGASFDPANPAGPLVAEDPVAAARAALAGCAADPVCVIASIGHPNLKGSVAYFEAIRRVL
jgi:hypothetical protein